VRAGHDVALVVSRSDARRGRGTKSTPSPTKRAALDLGLDVTDRVDDVLEVGAELGIVVAYGRLVPARILESLAMVNVHFSLLPRWRGAAPVERAILAGDAETGVCLMRLEETLDTGPVLASTRVRIDEGEHLGPLTDRLATLGAELLVDALAHGVDALPRGSPQRGEPTYAEKVRAEELHLVWTRPAAELQRVVRLERAWTTWRGERLRVLDAVAHGGSSGPDDGAPGLPGSLVGPRVRTGDGVLELLEVQPAGKRPMTGSAWWRGTRAQPGETLGGEIERR
jgi:methionyl-tRNA formyltransferase